MSVIIFLLVLSVLVLIHELGHYVAARIFGVKAEEFGYGFPPRALGFVRENGVWKRVTSGDKTIYKNTIWSLNWLPLGGFVRLKGEQGDHLTDTDSFQSKSGWKKFIILAAGVFMNWLLAASIFSAGFMVGVPAELEAVPNDAQVTDRRIEIAEVVAESAAGKGGLKAGDRMVKIDEHTPTDANTLRERMQSYTSSTPAEFVVLREGREERLVITPSELKEVNRVAFGVSLVDVGTIKFTPLRAMWQGISTASRYAGAIVAGFGQLIADLFQGGKQAAQVSGPVGIAVMTGQVAQRGIWALLQFTAILSLNLAVINFLPIPALDGGRALFVIMEGIRRKKHRAETEAMVHQIGFIVLLAIILIVTIKDIIKFVTAS